MQGEFVKSIFNVALCFNEVPVAQTAEHGASISKVMDSIPGVCLNLWNVYLECNAVWVKVFAKFINSMQMLKKQAQTECLHVWPLVLTILDSLRAVIQLTTVCNNYKHRFVSFFY